jgi:hypothetical protein
MPGCAAGGAAGSCANAETLSAPTVRKEATDDKEMNTRL